MSKTVKTVTTKRRLVKKNVQVEGRDAEIDRMSKMLEGGRPNNVVALEARNRSNERMINHLNIQIDMLQQKYREAERKYQDSMISKDDTDLKMAKLQARNRELELELKDVDRMAKRLQTDKEFVVKTADREMEEAKDELEKSRIELEGMDMTVSQFKSERNRMMKEISELKARIGSTDVSSHNLEMLVDKLQEEKRRLTQRNNKLISNEKELVLEIERLKRKNGPTKKSKTPSKLDAFIHSIEEERDYYRDQADTLQRLLRTDGPGTRGKSPIRSRPSSRAGSPARDLSPSKRDGKTSASVSQYETIVRVLEEEKEYYKKEYESLKSSKRSGRSSPTKNVNEESEIGRLTRERDELKNLLDKFERHMSEIQANVRVLTSERDKLNNMYEETKDELMRVRRELVASPKSQKTSLAAQAVLRRVENERDDAITDLRRVVTDRDSLRERLKIATETSLSDRAKLEQKVEDLESTLHTVEAERNELAARMNTLKDDIRNLDEQLKNTTFRLNEASDSASKNKSSSNQMKMLAEEAEKSLEETQRRLNRRESELQSQEERIVNLEERLTEVTRSYTITKDETNQLRNTLGSMDREKDSLQMTVDEKTEKIAQLNNELHDKDRFLSDLKIRVSEIEAQLEHANDSLNMKDRELKSMRRQLDSTGEDLTETSRSKDVAIRENRRLQDDLGVMTKENQKLNQELQDTLEDRENLKIQIQQYILEVKRIEDILAAKEQERSDLLDQYRKLSMEAEQYQTTSHQLESEGSNLRLEIMTKDSELRRLRDKVDNMEREIQEHLHAQQAYEIQVSNLTRSVANLEENLRQTEEDKQNLFADMTAVRELCSRLEGSKETLQRQLTASNLDKEQLQQMIEDLQQEADLLKSQLEAERNSLKGLEEVLQNNREKEFASQLSSQENKAENQMLKDRLALNDSKMQSQSREVASLRTRNVELEGDVERLRRQLTNERFERERASSELRRSGLNRDLNTSALSQDYSGTIGSTHVPRASSVPVSHSSTTNINRSYSPSITRSRSRSRSPGTTSSRYQSVETSYYSKTNRRISPERSFTLDDDDQTSLKDVL
ncbi:testis-specific gene 10 protein isoform X2 [Patella vulgata]|uniref:testis-specific gene 10 protein isoform X2 n=2 Tax=Patella vulgata TaxID=6465 RepID=UPI0024A8D09D|nr:testis-specific gene 10 protein isoform X2 [Patella vulgata]